MVWLSSNFILVFLLDYDKLFSSLIFFKIGILMKNKRIDSFFKSDRREATHVDENRTNSVSFEMVEKPRRGGWIG